MGVVYCVRCVLLVVWCLLCVLVLAAGVWCSSFATLCYVCWLLRVAGCMLLFCVVCCLSLCVVCCVLFVVSKMLFLSVLAVSSCLSFVVWCSLTCVVCWSCCLLLSIVSLLFGEFLVCGC